MVRFLATIVVVAVIAALAAHFVQVLLFEEVNPTASAGAAAGVSAVVAVSLLKKQKRADESAS